MKQRAPAHYLRHNLMTRVPRSFVYLDAEAHSKPAGRSTVQTFRLAVTAFDSKPHHRPDWRDREWAIHKSTTGLWKWVDERVERRSRTVVVAHNLAYDLRITNVLRELPALGWRLDRFRLDGGQTWATFRNGDRTIVLVDSMSWVPTSLAKLGELVGLTKPPLPAWDDSDDAWEARCRADVAILAEVWRRLMQWIVDDDLGNWKPTGAGQAWAAFRHRFMAHKILIHEDEDARAAERVSAWTGRCEVWRHGKPRGGPFDEWDFSAAYARIGYECDVPTKLGGSRERCTLDEWRRIPKQYRKLTECVVTTETPTVPARDGDRIFWPVGTFATTLWDNELALALDHGAQVAVSRVWWYRATPALREFCGWVLAMLGRPVGTVDPVVLLAVKHWSRALVGRFGARWSTWERIGHSPTDELTLGWAADTGAGETFKLLQVGHELQRQSEVFDAPDSVVSVMAWVMAEARVRLWHAMATAGFDHVVYVDTDALITDAEGSRRLAAAQIPGLRVKGSWRRVELLGPRQIITGGELRAAGIPRGSVRVSERQWQGEVWAELGTSLSAGESDAVRITPRTIELRGTDTRREHLAGGKTGPRRVELDAQAGIADTA